MRAIKTITITIVTVGLLAGSSVGVAAQDEESAGGVTTVTGTAIWSGTIQEATETETPDGIIENAGAVNAFRFAFPSDPRMSGNATVTSNWLSIEY